MILDKGYGSPIKGHPVKKIRVNPRIKSSMFAELGGKGERQENRLDLII